VRESPQEQEDNQRDNLSDRRRGVGDVSFSPGAIDRRASLSDRRSDANVKLFLFTCAGEHFALPTEFVSEIAPLKAMTPIPHAPDWIMGLMPLRGGVVPVLDLASKLGLTSKSKRADASQNGVIESKARSAAFNEEGAMGIVVSAHGCTKCLMIDTLGDVIEVGKYALEPPPPGLDVHLARHLGMIAQLEHKLLMVLDADSLARA